MRSYSVHGHYTAPCSTDIIVKIKISFQSCLSLHLLDFFCSVYSMHQHILSVRVYLSQYALEKIAIISTNVPFRPKSILFPSFPSRNLFLQLICRIKTGWLCGKSIIIPSLFTFCSHLCLTSLFISPLLSFQFLMSSFSRLVSWPFYSPTLHLWLSFAAVSPNDLPVKAINTSS